MARRNEQITITASSLRLLRACPRAYDLRYRQGVKPVRKSSALSFGSLVHAGLEAWWRGHLLAPDDRLADTLEAARQYVRDHASEVDAADAMRADAVLSMYHARWIADAGQWETLAAEVEYAAPVRLPDGTRMRSVERRGKIDAIAREISTGRTYLVEHKTTSEAFGPGSAYTERLTLDAQISHYMAGARALGFDPVGCLYDVLGKPKPRALATPPEQRRYTKAGELYANQRAEDEDLEAYYARACDSMASDPDSYFRRFVVVRTEAELAEAQADDRALIEQLRSTSKAGHWPRNPDSCIRYSSRCDYWQICAGQASADDGDLYEIRRPHEELSQQKKRGDRTDSAAAPGCPE
jgi:hypothetical protein